MLATIRSSFLLLAAAGGAVTVSAAVALPMLVGAPLVCFPIEVDAEASMPFAKQSEEPTVASKALPAAVEAALAGSADAQFHMELVRRTGMAHVSDASSTWSELIGSLEQGALAAAAEPEGGDAKARARRALRFFDLGYALEVGATLGHKLGGGKRGDGGAYLRKAVELSPEDPALRFGVALVLFQESLMADERPARTEAARACYVHLARALASDDARLRRNLLGAFGSFLDCKTHEQLVAESRRSLGGV